MRSPGELRSTDVLPRDRHLQLPHEAVASDAHRAGEAPRELKVSAVTAFELEFGARRSSRYEEVRRVIDAFFLNVEIVPFDFEASRHAGEIRAELTADGNLIGAYDLLIAGYTRSREATLVTNNVREFSRVPGLSIENWSIED